MNCPAESLAPALVCERTRLSLNHMPDQPRQKPAPREGHGRENKKDREGELRAQGKVGIVLANMSASPSSASRLGTKLEIHHGVAAFQSNSGAWPALK